MTEPVLDDFTTPVVLDGIDSTKVLRSRAHQTLTLAPTGITFEKDGKTTELAWSELALEQVNMQRGTGYRKPTFTAWALMGPHDLRIYPHEFDKGWTTGTIGRWLAHYRPDLALPLDGAMLPFGIPREHYRWVIPFAVLAGFVGSCFAAKSFVGGLGLMAVMVVIVLPFLSPRGFRLAGILIVALFGAWLLMLGGIFVIDMWFK